MGSKDVGG